MKTLVSILNHNLPEYTDYLYDNLSPYQSNIYDLIVIDNGSSSEKISKYTTHTLDSNSYMGGGFNAAMQLVLSSDEYDSLLFLNNDLIVFGYEFVKTLREEMFNNNFKIFSACFFNVEPTGQCFWKTMHNWGRSETRQVPFIDFQMPLIHKDVLQKIDQIDPDLIYGWGIDALFAIECKKNKWKMGVMDKLSALHYNSLTVKLKAVEFNVSEYCRRAEEGQNKFFTKSNLMNEFNQVRQEGASYKL
jgi:hypothetical protein